MELGRSRELQGPGPRQSPNSQQSQAHTEEREPELDIVCEALAQGRLGAIFTSLRVVMHVGANPNAQEEACPQVVCLHNLCFLVHSLCKDEEETDEEEGEVGQFNH